MRNSKGLENDPYSPYTLILQQPLDVCICNILWGDGFVGIDGKCCI